MENNVENVRYHTDRIAILLATYNGEQYLQEQLDSLLSQTCQDWVTYIHDDGSMDQTMKVIEEYTTKYPQKFVKVDGISTGGAKKNFFYLLSCVDAPYLMCCDQDDVWLPEKVEVTFQAMKQLEQEYAESGNQETEIPLLVFTELRVVDGKLNTIAETMSAYQQLACKDAKLSRMIIQNVVTGCTMMINRRLKDMMLQYQNIEHIIMHDWWGAIIAARFGQIRFIPEPTICYRQHEDNSVGAKKAGSAGYIRKRLQNIADIKRSLELTRIQTRELEQSFHLEQDPLIHEYGNLEKKNKIARLCFYQKKDVKKTGFSRKVGLVLWG